MSKKSSQEKTQDMCDAVAFGLNEGRKQRRQPEQTLEDKYRYMCELSEDMSREIYEQKKIITGAQIKELQLESKISLLKDFASNLFELNNGEYSLRDIDSALSYWEQEFEIAKIQFVDEKVER